MTFSRLVARPLLSSVFFLGAVNALRNVEQSAAKAKPVTDRIVPAVNKNVPQISLPEDERSLVRINAVVQLVAAAGLSTGRAPRLCAAVLGVSLVPTTLAGHAFWREDDVAARKTQQLEFAKNLSTLGGLILAALDTEGRPGVSWRARRAARDLKREARHAGKDLGYQAKIVKAKANLD